ncbi:MAG: DUF456 family protein [Patescibacteria group bacterium]
MGIFEIIVISLSLLIMVVGLLGIVIPNLPGVVLIWTGVFFYGSLSKFEVFDKNYMLFVTSLALFAILIEAAETIWGKRKASPGLRGIIGAVIGGIIGGVSGSTVLMVIGSVVGAAFGVILSGRDPVFAVETKDYRIILFAGSTIIQIALGAVIIESFLVRVFT